MENPSLSDTITLYFLPLVILSERRMEEGTVETHFISNSNTLESELNPYKQVITRMLNNVSSALVIVEKEIYSNGNLIINTNMDIQHELDQIVVMLDNARQLGLVAIKEKTYVATI